ncbi:transposase [mine drainage metagenome]|uniref:Transposase n=1 Tax=mine drainage metagenome TaxID=410659 RepID=T1CSF0_9ZZZZ
MLHDGSADSLVPFVTENVQEGTTVITDGWPSYNGVVGLGYVHEPRSQRAAKARGEDVGALLPGVHRVASLSKRWLASTHQGRFDPGHLPGYLNEFVFRFNRRRPRAGGFSSSGSFSSLSTMAPSATTTSRSADDLARSCRHPRRSGGTRPASNDYRPIVLGGSLTWPTLVSLDPRERVIGWLLRFCALGR